MVVWVTGVSASGKTTLSETLYGLIKENDNSVVLLDGDVLRMNMKEKFGYSMEERRKALLKYIETVEGFLDKGQNVIIATIANFPEIQEENRKRFKDYFEIYVKVDMETAYRRDFKGLYKKALAGETKDVVGIDIPFIEPTSADYVFDNNADDNDIVNEAQKIYKLMSEKFNL